MTCECGNPECDGVPDRETIEQHIREYGQVLIAVFGAEDAAPFIYTIGRTDRGEPELLVELDSDDDYPQAAAMLNFLGPRTLLHGQVVGGEGVEPYVAVSVPATEADADYLHEELVVQADRYYGRPVDVLCLVPAHDWAPAVLH